LFAIIYICSVTNFVKFRSAVFCKIERSSTALSRSFYEKVKRGRRAGCDERV
jgi:hypothetical protein